MSYHKENLKQLLGDIAWEICQEHGWARVKLRLVAEQAGVSATATYRHYRNKDDLKAEVMRRGFETLNQGLGAINAKGAGFAAYGAHYIEFGLEHPHIYDVMFGEHGLNTAQYPELKAASTAAFDGAIKGVQAHMQGASDHEVMIKAYHIWASVHGITTLLRHHKADGARHSTLSWIKENLEDYLRMTHF